MLLLSLSLFTLPVQTTNLRRNVKKQKTHHLGRSGTPFPLVNHLIFSECDHRRHPTSICAQHSAPPKAGADPTWIESPVFSKRHLVGVSGTFCVVKVGSDCHPLCIFSISVIFSRRGSFHLNQIETGKCCLGEASACWAGRNFYVEALECNIPFFHTCLQLGLRICPSSPCLLKG